MIKIEKYTYSPLAKKDNILNNLQLTRGICENDFILIEGFINLNWSIFNDKLNEIKLNLINKSKNIVISNDIDLSGNKFKSYIYKEDLFHIKNISDTSWDLTISIYNNNEIIEELELNYLENDSILFDNTLISSRDEMRAILLNEYGKIKLNLYNEISIANIINIVIIKNIIKIKYRTKNNIPHKNKDIITNILFGDKELRPFKTKYIGNKTYTCYYKSSNALVDIELIRKKDIRIIINNSGKEYTTEIKELNESSIYYSFLEYFKNSRYYKKISLLLYKKIFLKMPIKKKRVLFESFLGRNISGNPKYLYNYLVDNDLDKEYELIWILNNPKEKPNGNGKTVKRKTIKYYYYMATAGYWIFNSRQANNIIKRDGNIYLQTWHGTPLKRLGADMSNANMAGMNDVNKYKEQFRKNSSRWDYLLAQNEYSAEIFKRAFYFDKDILTYGYPANDILYKCNNQIDIDKLKDKFNIPKDKKVILYCPTWRDDKFFKKGHYKMSLELELDKMKKELGDEYIVLLRLHYLITSSLNLSDYEGFAYNFSGAYDIQELYLVSDVQITDYSSTMFDYATLRRPEIFFTYDLESYRDNLRGFYFDFENEAPGPIVTTTDEVIYWLKNLSKLKEDYKVKEENFYNKFCSLDSENSSKKVIERIFS